MLTRNGFSPGNRWRTTIRPYDRQRAVRRVTATCGQSVQREPYFWTNKTAHLIRSTNRQLIVVIRDRRIVPRTDLVHVNVDTFLELVCVTIAGFDDRQHAGNEQYSPWQHSGTNTCHQARFTGVPYRTEPKTTQSTHLVAIAAGHKYTCSFTLIEGRGAQD